jgi:hypothetical protein
LKGGLKGKKYVDSEQRLYVVKEVKFNRFHGPLWGYNLTYDRLAVVDYEFQPNPAVFQLEELKMIVARALKVERRSIIDPKVIDERMAALRTMNTIGEIIDYFRPFYHDINVTHPPWRFLLKSERDARDEFRKLLASKQQSPL